VILVFVQILKPPFIGLADNGDFPKVTGRLSLGPKGLDDKKIYFTSDYVHSLRYHWKGPVISSELALAWVATALVREIGRTDDFDIRYLGVLHLLFLASAFFLFLSLLRDAKLLLQLALPIFAIWIFSDAAYTAYLNSFYSDVATLLGLLLMVVSALHIVVNPRSNWKIWVIFSCSALLFITSKAQHGLWGIFPAAFVLLATSSRKWPWPMIGAGLCAALLCTIWIEFLFTPSFYKAHPLYNVIFFKITAHSATPLQDLSELGLPETDCRLIGSTAYDTRRPAGSEWLMAFYKQVGYGRVAHFYVRHPHRVLEILRSDLGSAAEIQPRALGTYRRVDGFPPRTKTSRFTSWSRLRGQMFAWWPLHILAWYVTVMTVSLWLTFRHRGSAVGGTAAVCIGVALTAILEYGFASLADAIETDRHLFIFNALTDLTVCFATAALLQKLSDLYGANARLFWANPRAQHQKRLGGR
jgi:hypothetical protein